MKATYIYLIEVKFKDGMTVVFPHKTLKGAILNAKLGYGIDTDNALYDSELSKLYKASDERVQWLSIDKTLLQI